MELRNATPGQPGYLAEETERNRRILRTLLQVMTGATLLMYLVVFVSQAVVAVLSVVTGALLVDGLAWLLLRRGQVRLASLVLVGGLWLIMMAGLFVADMRGNAPWVTMSLLVMAAGILLGSNAGLLLGVLTTLATLVYLVLNTTQTLPAINLLRYNPTSVWVVYSVILFAIAGLVALSNSSVYSALKSARENAEAQAEANRELEAIRRTLEMQVAERTQDLQTRSHYLQAAIDVSRATASILDIQRLIQTSVDLIREQFGLYYAGLFLVDPSNEWALLQAGTGEAGQKMLARNHRIRVGSGMIGWSVANAQPRIALDVGRDVMRMVNPDLPETQSEAAIPLRSRGRVLGALTVQSTRPDAFGEVEIAIFQSIADQLAIALDNARLLSESQSALEEARRAQGQISRRAWQEFLRSSGQQTVKYSFGEIATQADGTDEALAAARRQAIRTRKAVQFAGEGAGGSTPGGVTLLLPIPVRDQVVGVISFAKEGQGAGWKTEEIDLLEGISAQLGIALDSARLYQDTQRLAYREQLAGEVTTRIRQTLDIQTVLRTAVEEVQRSLNLPEVVISLAPPENN